MKKKKRIALFQAPKLENNQGRNWQNKRFINKNSYEQHNGIN